MDIVNHSCVSFRICPQCSNLEWRFSRLTLSCLLVYYSFFVHDKYWYQLSPVKMMVSEILLHLKILVLNTKKNHQTHIRNIWPWTPVLEYNFFKSFCLIENFSFFFFNFCYTVFLFNHQEILANLVFQERN